ncbi:HAMP domain-containing sensor histidine kinase [Rapidithrix thailandica]|uniref:histidine kinase n=1 Tax=Rapidithrix thailandica TaxID=413964 RepID=A0AAW9SB08_9BACT
MEQVVDFLKKLFLAESWPPRWICGTWTEFHGWLYIFSNLAIWAAYFTIPLILFYFIKQRKHELPFVRVFWLFILFILACGTTHLMDALLFYYPAYRLSGLILFITALVSWGTIVGLAKVMPQALALKSPIQLEEIIQERTYELEKLSLSLAHQNEQLNEFRDITSHNLRSPVSNLVSLIQLYEDEKNPAKQQLYVRKLRSVSNQLMVVLDELHSVVKVTKDHGLHYEELQFENVLYEVTRNLTNQINHANAQITYDFSVCPSIFYPKIYLENILLNLLSNALKYRSPHRAPEIHLSSARQNGEVVFSCKDNGLGLDMQKYGDKVFKLYKTFHRRKDARGLGLFLTKSQVESMGGRISLESKVGQGTVFTIIFQSQNKTL